MDLHSLGVAEVSALNLEADLRLDIRYNCESQMLEGFRLRSLSEKASANRVESGMSPKRPPALKLKLAGYAACAR